MLEPHLEEDHNFDDDVDDPSELVPALALQDLEFGTRLEVVPTDNDDSEDARILSFLFAVFLPDTAIGNIEAPSTEAFIRLFESLSKQKLHDALQGSGLSPNAEYALRDLGGMSEEYVTEYLFALRPLAKMLKEDGGRLILHLDGDFTDERILQRANALWAKFFKR